LKITDLFKNALCEPILVHTKVGTVIDAQNYS